MRKHKWRRRLFLLVFLVLIGVIVLKPNEEREDHTTDITASATPGNRGDDGVDDMPETTVSSNPEEGEEEQDEETIVSRMIDRVASGEIELSEEDSIRQALEEAEHELKISLTQDNKGSQFPEDAWYGGGGNGRFYRPGKRKVPDVQHRVRRGG